MSLLRFGIPSLDRLISGTDGQAGFEIRNGQSASICMLGPDGTGKSVLALHLAAHYLSDVLDSGNEARAQLTPKVLYVSTDLNFDMANQRTWIPFALGNVTTRTVPFEDPRSVSKVRRKSSLTSLKPLGSAQDSSLTAFLAQDCAEVGFVDLASETVGDDWGFVNRLLSSLPEPNGQALHLVVLDAVEGFETLVGDLDAYGQVSSRRSRIAQILRSAFNKAHLLFVVEEPREGVRLPEEFVTDVVIRLRNVSAGDYVRRTVQVDKARGQEHVRGQHPYVIRSGRGSTTGINDNVDDPSVTSDRKTQSYIHVFPSLHQYSRAVMQTRTAPRPGRPNDRFAAFGVHYLDNMLAGNVSTKLSRNGGFDNQGLPSATVTALIGDSLTQKSRLARAFLSRAFSSLSLGKAERKYDGIAVLLTTIDTHATAVAKEVANWLFREDRNFDPGNVDRTTESYLQTRLICRRLEIHDLSAPIFMHIVQRSIVAAQEKLETGLSKQSPEHRFARSQRIRVVIDDFSTIMSTYPGMSRDPLFLPTLLFYLRREGVTTLIIDTHTGEPTVSQVEPLVSELRTLVDQRIYTWHVPFFGENRVAISAIPPLTAAVIRELKTDMVAATSSATRVRVPRDQDELVVDPGFELYSGLEERNPKPVPLGIFLYEETPAFRTYIDQENRLYQRVFAPLIQSLEGKHERDILIGIPTSEYDSLRDFCYVENEIRLDHTLVFQIDEFWAIRKNKALQDLTLYLTEPTYEDGKRAPGVDPFSLFQPTSNSAEAACSHQACLPVYKQLMPGETADRVPFVWDFGFLVCRERAWDYAAALSPAVKLAWVAMRKVTDSFTPDGSHKRVVVSWADFLHAARNVAQIESARSGETVPAFDVSLLAPESFACLMLEVWASLLWDSGSKKLLGGKGVRDREWAEDRAQSLLTWFSGGLDRRNGEVEAFPKLPDDSHVFLRKFVVNPKRARNEHDLQLNSILQFYCSWIMLGEILDVAKLHNKTNAFDFICREADPKAIAARHWYKTASVLADSFSPADPTVAVSLPGHFSVRGDWFLAIARNSRSLRLGTRAVDLISSRRANIARLQSGMGLPVRDILPEKQFGRLRTRLFKAGRNGERRSVSYADIRYIGADDPGGDEAFSWLWRSGLKDYDRHARTFEKWLYRIMIVFAQLKLDKGSDWTDSFQIVKAILGATEGTTLGDILKKEKLTKPFESTMTPLLKRLVFLVAELKQGSPR